MPGIMEIIRLVGKPWPTQFWNPACTEIGRELPARNDCQGTRLSCLLGELREHGGCTTPPLTEVTSNWTTTAGRTAGSEAMVLAPGRPACGVRPPWLLDVDRGKLPVQRTNGAAYRQSAGRGDQYCIQDVGATSLCDKGWWLPSRRRLRRGARPLGRLEPPDSSGAGEALLDNLRQPRFVDRSAPEASRAQGVDWDSLGFPRATSGGLD
jgi:hypothetical protein